MSTLQQATALHNQGKTAEAEIAYKAVLAKNPREADALLNLAVLLAARAEYTEAESLLKKMIAAHPKLPHGHFFHGNLLFQLGRYDAAIPPLTRAATLNPNDAEAARLLGSALDLCGRETEAITVFDRYCRLQPANAALTRFTMAQLHLRIGNYVQGWELYESRWQLAEYQSSIRGFTQPMWLGDVPVAGKTILIHPEQGFGDMLQFCRYAPLLEAMGARVIVETKAPLLALMRSLSPTLTLVKQGDPLPPFDLHCPVMSLPHAFKTTLDTIPATVPYLSPSAEKIAHWRSQLGPKTRPRIGLVWSGSLTSPVNVPRSVPFAELAPLLALPFEFHSLQKDFRPEERAAIEAMPELIRHGETVTSFEDTAAIIGEMDLVISTCTSLAHLTGALGKPLWMMLHDRADFRWLLTRNDSPWYPTARLFRQTKRDDWSNVIGSVIEALETLHS